MKQQKNRLLKLTYLLVLGISMNSYCQIIAVCQEDFHGVGDIVIDCEEHDIIVTSTPSEGSEGTIISGILESDGTIRFIPGHSKVRFIPNVNEQERDETRSKAGGGGGNKGVRYGFPATSDINDVKLFPNPVIKNLSITAKNSKVIRYQVYTIESRLLIDEGLKNDTYKEDKQPITINLSQLKPGFHMLKLTLKNGTVITKHIIKH